MRKIISIAGGCALLWSLESVRPLQRYGQSRLRRALPNLALTALVILLNLALSTLVAAVSRTVAIHVLDAIVGIAALDLATYCAHVVMHKSAFAWRFHRDLPKDALVVHPLPAHAPQRSAFNEGPDVEAVRPGGRRRSNLELEPGDLIRADVRRGLDRDPVVSRPAGVR